MVEGEEEARQKAFGLLTSEKTGFIVNQLGPALAERQSDNVTMSSLASLCHSLQQGLTTMNPLTQGDRARDIHHARIEYGASIPATMLDRTDLSMRYEVENLTAWLNGRGVSASTSLHNTSWRQANDVIRTGEDNLHLSKKGEELTPGGIAAGFVYVATETARVANLTDQQRSKEVLRAVSAVATTLAADIESVVLTDRPLSGTTVLDLLTQPLAKIGIKLEPQRAAS